MRWSLLLLAAAVAAGEEQAQPAAAAAGASAEGAAGGTAPAPATQMMAVDEQEAALLQYLRAVRRLKHSKGGSGGGSDQYFGMQQYFTPHPGRVYPEVAPPMDLIRSEPAVDPYTVEGFYAPALWTAPRHIAVAQPGSAVLPHPLSNVYAAVPPRALGQDKHRGGGGGSVSGAPYWGYQQMFTPHPGRIYDVEPDYYGDRVVLGGPHEFRGNGLMQPDLYRTDGIPTGGHSMPLQASAPGAPYRIFPSPVVGSAGVPGLAAGNPEFASAVYHPV